MGCCFSSNERNGDQGTREPLLRDSARQTPSSSLPVGSNSNSYGSVDPEGRLNQILQKTAENLIDIADVEPHSLDRSEVMGRTKEYNQRVQSWRTGIGRNANKLPSSSNPPHVVLSGDLVPASDVSYISDKIQVLSQALKSMEVKSGDPVVVPFAAT